MKKIKFCRMAPVAILFALYLAAATGAAAQIMGEMFDDEDPQEVRRRLVVGVEDQHSIIIELPVTGTGTGTVQAALELPRHGYIAPGFGELNYYLDPGYFGRDSMALVVDGREVLIELLILPRFIPFTGRFDGIDTAPALWDNQSRTFLLCDPLQADTVELSCDRLPVYGLGAEALIPLAWPDQFGQESPVLFEPVTGRFLNLARHGKSMLSVVGSLEVPLFPGGWPVFGDSTSGNDTLTMVAQNGEVYLRAGIHWLLWPKRMEVPGGDGLVRPIVLPRPDSDALALIHPVDGSVYWMRLDPEANEFGIQPEYGSGVDFRRPIAWSNSGVPNLTSNFRIFFLNVDDGVLWLKPAFYYPGHPITIPVKFPDDPPGGGGGGGGGG